ncbi:AroM protein [Klenkia soli]|uniref:AroM protein n=1 Tax=Klenkia soli TaxID=1052260 RepID=A0A1H0GPE9_9ACTN|nr:AroM family protein [Klenkia soli]SDO08728.1 AroM protein [Klenkia soli]
MVALIHATPAAMAPARGALLDRFPGATLWNLLDDRLITEAEQAGGLTDPLRRRMEHLIDHAAAGGADAVLLTCSMYGSVVQDSPADWTIPVLGSDDALFARVVELAPGRIAVLSPNPTAVRDTNTRLGEYLDTQGLTGATVTGTVVNPGQGPADLEHAVTTAAQAAAADADLIVIGQFSLSPAVAAAAAAVSIPVLSPPHLAAEAIAVQLDRR